MRARLAAHGKQAAAGEERALAALARGDATGAAVSVRQALHALTGYLLESWGERDNSWGRLGTRLDALAARHAEEERLEQLWELYGLGSGQVEARMASAPAGIRHRHWRSFEARTLQGEDVSPWQDARDVLLAFSTRELRSAAPPYPFWVGLDVEPQGVKQRVMALRQLLDGLGR